MTVPASPLPRRCAESLGIPAAALLDLADRLDREGLDPHALLVARGDAVAFEVAWAPYRLERPALVYSASKTYTALAIGYLADEGRLDLEAAVGELLGVSAPDGAPTLTVRHLLTMNTGHTAAQIGRVGDDPRELLRVAPDHVPGTHFAYNTPATHALSAIVTEVTGEPLTAYLRPRLLDPLGIGDRWMSSYGGIEHGGSGFHLTVDDLARTGIALSDAAATGGAGVFGGTPVVPAWYVEEMTRPWSDTAAFDGPPSLPGETNDWALGYGYQLWRSRHGFRLDGAAGQFGLVVPDLDLVIAYQGSTLETQEVLRAFWALVDAVEVATAAGGPVSSNGGAGAFAAPRDAWSSRERLDIMPGVPYDTDGLALVDAADGWTLSLPGVGELPVGPQSREATLLAARTREKSVDSEAATGDRADSPCRRHTPDRLALATRGETRGDGSVLVHVVDTTSPHRVIVERAAGGALRAGWHIPPLGSGWPALRVPAVVTRVTVPAEALLLDMDGTLVDSHAADCPTPSSPRRRRVSPAPG